MLQRMLDEQRWIDTVQLRERPRSRQLQITCLRDLERSGRLQETLGRTSGPTAHLVP